MSNLRVYLASPQTQQQAEHAAGMPVLLSYALVGKRDWIWKGYAQSFDRLLFDSGAFSELNSGVKVDGMAYRDWHAEFGQYADAVAGLDDISGDWRRSLGNYETFGGFPTIHDSDPPELLKDLIPIARERGGWLGIGLVPPRQGKERFVRWVSENIPDDIHLHGWALRGYSHVRRLNSVDSTNWWRDAMKLKTLPDTEHLHYGECLEIVVKRYQRSWPPIKKHIESDLFAGVHEETNGNESKRADDGISVRPLRQASEVPPVGVS